MANRHRFSAFWLRSSVSEDFTQVFSCGFFLSLVFGFDFYTFFLDFFYLHWSLRSLDNVLFAWPCLGLPLALPWFGLVPLRGIVFQLDPLVFDPSCIFGICITFLDPFLVHLELLFGLGIFVCCSLVREFVCFLYYKS